MIISNNYTSQSFGSLKVCYDAQNSLRRLPRPVLQKIYRLGSYLEDTKHVDMKISSNLTPFIQGKCVNNGGIRPPFNLIKPQEGEKDLKIIGHHVGKVPYGNINGDSVEISIGTRNYYSASEFYNRLNNASGEIEQTSILTRLIDACIESPASKLRAQAEEKLSKSQVIDNIMSEFGTWSK